MLIKLNVFKIVALSLALSFSQGLVGSVAHAFANRTAANAGRSDALNQIVFSVVEQPRVLLGMTNAERALGSTTFSLPVKRQNQRAELRAALIFNQRTDAPAMGASSNPEMFHLDIAYLTSAAPALGQGIRLNYRKLHTASPRVGTRIITYESAPILSAMGPGRLVATVQQRALPELRAWKTTATLLQFVSK